MPKRKRENTDCSICMGKVEAPAKLSGCTHTFCKDCILEWAKRENSCPNCRATFKHIKCGRKKIKVKHAKQRPDRVPTRGTTRVIFVDPMVMTSRFMIDEEFRNLMQQDVSNGNTAAERIMNRIRRDLVRLDRATPSGIFEVMQYRIPIRQRLSDALDIWNMRHGANMQTAITVA
jgi:hypothetical protein